MGLKHWLQLSLTQGVGPILIHRMIEAFGGVEGACGAKENELRGVEGIGGKSGRQIAESLRRAGDEVEGEMKRAREKGVKIISLEDGSYPVMLKSIPDPPAVLYVKGTLEDRDLNALAMVGSRKCSYYGREQAERFAALLAGAGFTVVSGGARGIDSAGHRGALSHPMGRTIAVLGCGVDVVYPPENEELFKQIVGRGAVISEYGMGTPPVPENFPRRNRIISGMSRGVLVVEADAKSGALITARQACEDHGRPVFAIPGRVDNPTSAGVHRLIREGAALVTGLEEILEGLGPVPAGAMEPSLFAEINPQPDPLPQGEGETRQDAELSEYQRKILLVMTGDEASVDTLVERTGLAAEQVLPELTYLSLKGLIRRVDGNTYARR